MDYRTINHGDIWAKDLKKITKDDKIVVLDNFEYNNEDHKTNSSKLKLLEKLQYEQKRVIIVSEVHPTEILDFYIRSLDDKNLSTKNKNNQEYANALENWRHIFCNFVEIYLPLDKSKQVNTSDSYGKEMQHGKYLRKIYRLMEKGKKEEKEDIILEIQQYANSYYFGLWNALTSKEKFAVYDLAKDGFINTGNKQVINTLLKKGLIHFDDRLKLMNRSFSNFVLSVVKEGEAVEMNKEVRKKGKWVNIKLVIILILIALITLIAFGEPDFFKNINSIVIAFAGVATVIPTLSRMYTMSSKIK